MKILSKSDAEKMLKQTKENRRLTKNSIAVAANKVEVGQAVILNKKDWTYKSKPHVLLGSILNKKDKKFKILTIADSDDYLVYRLK